jgi:hypothetical protein
MDFDLYHADIHTNSSKYLADANMKCASEALMLNILGAPSFRAFSRFYSLGSLKPETKNSWGAKKAAVVFALSLVPFPESAPALDGYLRHQSSHATKAASFHTCIAGGVKCEIY